MTTARLDQIEIVTDHDQRMLPQWVVTALRELVAEVRRLQETEQAAK